MFTFLESLRYVLYLYSALVLARLVLEVIRQFARAWYPTGVVAIGIESVYLLTDPPIKALRRAIPPLRLGGASLDLSILILLLLISLLRWGVSSLAAHVA